jgi:chemotaxis protein MotB
MKRSRRKKLEDHTNHERWLVSYADFITLLFAFFVVMYAVSSVNEGKYRVLSNTLTDAFREPTRSSDPIQVGEIKRSAGGLTGDALSQSLIDMENHGGPEPTETLPEDEPGFKEQQEPMAAMAEQKRLGFIASNLESVMRDLVDKGEVSIEQFGSRVEMNVKSQVLFDSGSARLSSEAIRILRDVSKVLKPVPNPLSVEGYTDNVPIRTAAFPSNWELSAARAASVVHLFTRLGVDPQRLAAVGYGEHRPVAGNDTSEGRQRNRRVVLVIHAGQDATARLPQRHALPGGAP